jgi:hypothetical protein
MGSAMAALVAVLGFAMLVAGAQSQGFTEQFQFYPSDGYHVQTSPDGQSANLVLTQGSGNVECSRLSSPWSVAVVMGQDSAVLGNLLCVRGVLAFNLCRFLGSNPWIKSCPIGHMGALADCTWLW